MNDALARNGRIQYLDALRGVAILLVVGFHAYARWPGIVPYGDQFAHLPIFRYGWIGVELFFLVSGFVILMTLENCHSMGQFLYRRWLRLFPAMLIVSVLVFSTAGFFSERPNGQPNLLGLLPGLLFIEPDWLSALLQQPVAPLEGSFWSLFVEFKFYLIAAVLYFKVSQARFVHCLTAMFLAYVALLGFGRVLPAEVKGPLFQLAAILSLKYFGWFAAGAAFYLFTKSRTTSWFVYACGVALISSLVVSEKNMAVFAAACLVSVLFAALVASPALQRCIDIRVFQFFGVISYPLYLMHEGAMVSMTVKLARALPDLPAFALPVVAVGLMSVPAWFIAKHLERQGRRAIEAGLQGVPKLGSSTKQR